MSKKVKDSVLFITGANRGIGKALVEVALQLGAAKIYAAARDVQKLESFKKSERVVPVALDVTHHDQIKEAANLAKDTQILINNAGVATMGTALSATLESARKEMEVNYFGVLDMILNFADILIQNKGSIVNVGSVASWSSFPPLCTYSASKAAVHSLTQGVRAELRPKGVFVAGVYPGPIDTDMAKDIDMQKETPENVAQTVYKELDEGREDIFTDSFAKQFILNFDEDRKELENQNAAALL